LKELQEMLDSIRWTALGNLTIQYCGKLRAMPRGMGELGALMELTLQGLDELQEMPDLIGLTALGNLTIEDCSKLSALPRGMGKLGALKQLTLRVFHELQEMPYGGEEGDGVIVSVLLPISVGLAQHSKTQLCVEVLGMREGPVLLGLAAAPKSVVADG
jgi:hypothetical protein